MTSSDIRQSFLDFFKSKQHTIVPSSSLMPDSPNLLFTNAGMNQFVPIFLGQVKCPYNPPRAADTQKCIRAGGKHNDLDDVGLDTYHHTFFEMLGNWSFGDYFKKEAIEWAWELIVGIWKFPPQRLYATVYNPDKSINDPSEFDQEAWNHWAEKFRSVGLDPAVHIVNGNKKDNFWMMGDTGPCGPCSELHVDLTPAGDTKGSLVNKGDARCIEIWNLVFIQFNANPDGTFSPLPARHVDTGMGFERVTSIIQGTKGLKDFTNAKISNYETDIFRPIFDALEKLSGKKYGSTLPKPGSPGDTEQEKIDVAFRVIADHIRTLSFAIADGIQPGIKGRNGVLRSIHKRMIRYASTIGVADDVLLKTQNALIDTLTNIMGNVFPELRSQNGHIKEVLRQEADVFNKTFRNGILAFLRAVAQPDDLVIGGSLNVGGKKIEPIIAGVGTIIRGKGMISSSEGTFLGGQKANFNLPDWGGVVRPDSELRNISGEAAFELYDTYGFPLDLTELMARERALTVDKEGYEKAMEKAKRVSRDARVTEVIELSQIKATAPTKFIGYEKLEAPAKIVEVVSVKDKTAVVLDYSPFYAEMGGQVGDTGDLIIGEFIWSIVNTQKSGDTFLHVLGERTDPKPVDLQIPAIPGLEDVPPFTLSEFIPHRLEQGAAVNARVKASRRQAIQRHHTVTHLLHWALHEVASRDASQKGSFVGPDKLTFDFNSAPLTPAQISDIEKLVNERILENAGVSWTEVPYANVKSRKDVMQFFGDKYGDQVRVVQIGGRAGELNGYSMELCGGTHTRATGEIGLFRIVSESAVAAGVRRIEAVAGLEAYRKATDEVALIKNLAGKVNAPVHELDKKIEALLAHQKDLEKQVKAAQQREASNAASELLERVQTVNGVPAIIHNIGGVDGDFLQAVADSLKGRFKGVIVLGGVANGAVALVAAVSPDFTAKIQAGKIIQAIAPIVGGKGGGKPDNARGGGKDAAKLDEALAKVRELVKA